MDGTVRVNALGQPIGEALPGWSAPPSPSRTPMQGRYCTLRALAPSDAPALWDAFNLDREGRNWTYLTQGPYERFEDFAGWVEQASRSEDPLFHAVVGDAGTALGVAAYLRITPQMGVIEVGHIHFSPALQRTRAATEAMYLMMRRAFELGYRRYEWKCDALNGPSRRAAQRLGFSYEGIFRQAIVTKGRNRDTAWYACIDREWPSLRAAFEQWLSPGNFDEGGRQRRSLSDLTAPVLVARG